jgi:hypothetical protein
VKIKTWSKTKVQGLLRHRHGKYYARLYIAGKEKWLPLNTRVQEIARAKLDIEKKAMAEAKKTGWEPQQNGLVKTDAAIAVYFRATVEEEGPKMRAEPNNWQTGRLKAGG